MDSSIKPQLILVGRSPNLFKNSGSNSRKPSSRENGGQKKDEFLHVRSFDERTKILIGQKLCFCLVWPISDRLKEAGLHFARLRSKNVLAS